MKKRWPIIELGKVLKLCIDAAPTSSQPEFPIAGVYSFGRGLFKRQSLPSSQTTYKYFHRLHEGDFVISVPKGWEGALARVTEEFDGMFLSPVFPTFRPIHETLDVRYLEWFCKRSSVWEELRRRSRGIGARRESLSPEAFLSMEIPLPTLGEQRRIVARIEELAAQIHEARTLRQQAAEEAIVLVSRTASQMFAEAGSRFGKEPLGNHVKIQGGFAFKSSEYVEAGLPIIRIANLESEVVHPNGSPCMPRERLKEFDRFVLSGGDVLIALTGPPKLGIVPKDCGKWLLNQRVGRFVLLDLSRTEPRFVYWVARAFQQRIEDAGYGGAQPNVSSKDIEEMEFPFPPLTEQHRIVSELDALQAEVDRLKRLQEETSKELEALLPSILDKAFKGEL